MPLIAGADVPKTGETPAGWGLTRYPAGTRDPFPAHFHDCDEWYFLLEGRMRVRSEGQEYDMSKGSVLLTKMGDVHEILEVLEDATMFWLEGPLRGEMRPGHLHR